MMVISEIRADIQAIKGDVSLYKEINFDGRADAIDFIDFHIIDRIEGLLQNIGPKEKLITLKYHAEQMKQELEKVDINLFNEFREKIRTGIYTKSSFTKTIGEYVGYDVSDIDQLDKIGYDNLDIFINELLSEQPIPEPTMARKPEMVFYQKTPARIIFEIGGRAKLNQEDVFFDIGSGLGQVAILMNLISGATTIGVEYEPAYCNYAISCAAQLNLSNVEFINADARKGDYSKGTVFFMYTPFEGNMLQDMLDVLQKESLKRMIRVFTYGPCSPQVATQNWLNCINGKADNQYKLYEFISLDVPNNRIGI